MLAQFVRRVSRPHSIVGEQNPPGKAAQDVPAILKPSKPALELASVLGRSFAWVESLRDGGSQFKCRGVLSGDVALKAEAIKSDRMLSPSSREDQLKELRHQAKLAAKKAHSVKRANALDWCATVRLYERHRERIQKLPPDEQRSAAKELIAARWSPDPQAMGRLDGKAGEQKAQRKADFSAKQILMSRARSSSGSC